MTPKTQNKKIWVAGTVVVAVIFGLIAYVGVISPKLSSASTTRGEAAAASVQNTVLQVKNAKLKAQNDKVGALKASLRAGLAALPFDSGLPAYTRQLSAQATASKVTLTSITFSGGAATGAAATPAAAPTDTTTTTAAATTAAPTAAAAAATSLVAIAVSLASTGTGPNQLLFLKAIQVIGPRRSLVTSTALAPAAGTSIDGSTTMTLQLTIFSAPLNAAGQAALIKLMNG